MKTALEAAFDVVGEAADGISGYELVVATRPDVAVIDLGLPGMDGITLTQKIRADSPRTHVVIMTMIDLEDEVLAALAAGADAYCLKSSPVSTLDRRRTHRERRRRVFRSADRPRRAGALLASRTAPRVTSSPLTPRESEVLRLIADGKANTEIAARVEHRPRAR